MNPEVKLRSIDYREGSWLSYLGFEGACPEEEEIINEKFTVNV